MAAVNPKRQSIARSTLDGIFSNDSNVWVIHYSCESFYNPPEGRSPRITSIALRKLDSAQTVSFSINKVAEIRGVSLPDISEHYDCLEIEMLHNFYDHLSRFQQMRFLHWNMRDANYGFQAIEHRFRVLGGKESELYHVDEKSKTDLARLLIDIYGLEYIGHPRLEKLLEKNDISRRDFLSGAEEAQAFESKKFLVLHLSTLRKVDVIANIAERVHNRSLKTNTSWWDMHGGRLTQVFNWVVEHPIWGIAGVGLTLIIAIIAFACQG